MKELGTHIITQLYECDQNILNDIPKLQELFLEACNIGKATVLQHTFYQFTPQGVTGFVLLAQSHVSVHTWPEHNYAMLDILTCGMAANPWDIFQHIKEGLKSQRFNKTQLTRGIVE